MHLRPVLKRGRTVEHHGRTATVVSVEREQLWVSGRAHWTTWVLIEFVDGGRRFVRPDELEAPQWSRS